MLQEHFITTVPQLKSSESRLDFLVPGFSTNSYTRSRPARKDATNRNLLRQSFIAYIFRSQSAREQELYCLHLQEPESKSARAREQARARARALLLTSLGARAQESKRARVQEREWRNPVPFKENYSPPRTYYSLIGCSPSAELSSRGRQSTWGGELPLAHAQII